MSNQKKRRRLKKGVSAGLIAVCLAAAGLLALLLTPVFDIDTITVRGNKTVSREDIVKGSGIVSGTNIFEVSLRRVKNNLEGMERISSAKIKRVFPSTISITVVEGAPVVYVYNDGDCVGITSDGRVVNVVGSVYMPSPEPAPKTDEHSALQGDDSEAPNSGVDEVAEENKPDEIGENGEPDEAGEPGEAAASGESPSEAYIYNPLDRAIVTGMGDMSYKVGGVIKFDDEAKSENLFKLLNDFLNDEICADMTSVDMSLYDSVSMIYNGKLKINLGPVEELSYKLKCFKTILADQIGKDAEGTLDLQRLTYDPKNN